MTPPSGWYADPTGRHAQRYWDGTRWTDHVVTGNSRFIDPLAPSAPSIRQDQLASRTSENEPSAMIDKTKDGAQAAALAAMGIAAAVSSTGAQTYSRSQSKSSPVATEVRSIRKDTALSGRHDPAPKAPGWYPDPDVEGGTRYSDGSTWTGDIRPPRRPFAAPCSMTPMQYLLPLFLVLLLFTSIMAGGETGDYSGVFWVSLVFVIVLVFSVWMGRGKGPSTSAIENRIANEKKEAEAKRRSANIASFFSGFGRRASPPANTINAQTAAVAQINALSAPDTARALQNLQNLLYTQALTDDEFQAAKDKLLGPSLAVSQTEQIEQLAELHRQGVLGDLEFASAKARVLGI